MARQEMKPVPVKPAKVPACEICMFWKLADADLGHCLRFPNGTNLVKEVTSTGPLLHQPVKRKTDWCGEYKPQ